MQIHLAYTILKKDNHTHSHVAFFDELHNGLVIGLLHIVSIDGKYNVALTHSSTIRWTTIFHIVHIGNHLQLLVAFVVYAIALECEAIRVVLFLHNDGSTSSILIWLGGQETLRFIATKDVCGP